MNARRHLSSGENGMIFHFICCKDALKKSTKFELVSWLQGMNYESTMLMMPRMKKIHNLTWSLKAMDVFQNPPIYKIK